MALLYGFIPTKTSHTHSMRVLCPTFFGNLNDTFMESYGMYAFAVWRLQSSLSIHCLNPGAHPSPLIILSSNYYVQYISNGHMLQQHYKSFHKPHIGPIPIFQSLYSLPLCYPCLCAIKEYSLRICCLSCCCPMMPYRLFNLLA